MGLLDRFWDATTPLERPAAATLRQSAHERQVAHATEARNRMQKVEYDSDGTPLLWFDVTVTSLGGVMNVPIAWPARDQDDARDTFLEWINSDDWHTVDYVENGAHTKLTFRGSWVAGFMIGAGRKNQ